MNISDDIFPVSSNSEFSAFVWLLISVRLYRIFLDFSSSFSDSGFRTPFFDTTEPESGSYRHASVVDSMTERSGPPPRDIHF